MGGMLTLEQERFTLRQRQVVHLISEGCSNLEIADRLPLSRLRKPIPAQYSASYGG
jgi:ATP/maltotriose-dependent transcriptional regulator MalT